MAKRDAKGSRSQIPIALPRARACPRLEMEGEEIFESQRICGMKIYGSHQQSTEREIFWLRHAGKRADWEMGADPSSKFWPAGGACINPATSWDQ